MVNLFCFINAILFSRLFCCMLLPSAYWTVSSVCSLHDIIVLVKYALLLFVNMTTIVYQVCHCNSFISFWSEFAELFFNTIKVGKPYLVS